MEKTLGKFTDFLKRKNLKNTLERRVILETVMGHTDHFRIEDIIHQVEASAVPVSRATVYRTMALLEESGILNSIKNDREERLFELAGSHHDHLICMKCGEITEFYSPELEKLQADLCAEHGFEISRHVMKMYGLCKKCRE